MVWNGFSVLLNSTGPSVRRERKRFFRRTRPNAVIGPVIEPSIFHVCWKTMTLTCKYRTLKTPRSIAGSFEIVTIPKTRVHQLQTISGEGDLQLRRSQVNVVKMNMMQRRAFQPMLRSRGQLCKNAGWLDRVVQILASMSYTTPHSASNIALQCSPVTDTDDNQAEIRGELASWVRYDRTTPLWQNSLEEM